MNLASRLESLSGSGRIIIGEATWRAIQRDDPDLAATCVALPPATSKEFRAAVTRLRSPVEDNIRHA